MVIVFKFCIYWYGQVLRSLSFADVPIIIIIQCNLWEKKYCVLLRYIIICYKSRSFLLVENIHYFCCCWYIRSFDLFLQLSLSIFFTGLEYQLQSARRELCWWHHNPSKTQTPHNNKTTTTIQRDCKTSLSESDLWQQIDLHFFTSYIATTIINEHDKLVQVFPNLINVCRNSDQIGPL